LLNSLKISKRRRDEEEKKEKNGGHNAYL